VKQMKIDLTKPETLPPIDTVVVLIVKGGTALIGGRSHEGDDGWLWSEAVEAPTYRRGKWSAECDFSDIKPVAWLPMPDVRGEL